MAAFRNITTFRLTVAATACTICRSGYRATGRRYSTKNDGPKPFLNSDAHKHRVLSEYILSKKEMRKGRFGIPIGFSLFAFIIYMGWIREYGEEDKKRMDFLTRDIKDKIPPTAYIKLKKGLEEQEKLTNGKGTP